MGTISIDLHKRILPVLLFCQANKGDLSLYKEWANNDDAGKKLFFAYYSGLFCRILCLLENIRDAEQFVQECTELLDKYNWYDIHAKDLEAFKADGPYGCEVPAALSFIDGVDNVAWKNSGFSTGRDAVCAKCWSFADVRGCI